MVCSAVVGAAVREYEARNRAGRGLTVSAPPVPSWAQSPIGGRYFPSGVNVPPPRHRRSIFGGGVALSMRRLSPEALCLNSILRGAARPTVPTRTWTSPMPRKTAGSLVVSLRPRLSTGTARQAVSPAGTPRGRQSPTSNRLFRATGIRDHARCLLVERFGPRPVRVRPLWSIIETTGPGPSFRARA